MASIYRKGYTASISNVLTTELNSLAFGSWTALGTEIDNTSTLDLYLDLYVSLATFGATGAASTSPNVAIALVQTVDGTNYPDWSSGAVTAPNQAYIGAIDVLPAVTQAQKLMPLRFVEIPPAKFKLALLNSTGHALASSGSTVGYRTHSLQAA